MGKVKRARQKVHAAAVKTNQNKEHKTSSSITLPVDGPPRIPVLGENVFAGIDLKKYNLNTSLPDNLDARSMITSKSLKELKMKKKDKRKLRHELWIQNRKVHLIHEPRQDCNLCKTAILKLNTAEALKKKEKEKKKREQTPIVGDIGALADALPTLDLLMKTSTKGKNKQQSSKIRSTQKTKKRQKQMLKDISIFHKVLKHPEFQKDPTSTIAEHLLNWQKKQEEMDET